MQHDRNIIFIQNASLNIDVIFKLTNCDFVTLNLMLNKPAYKPYKFKVYQPKRLPGSSSSKRSISCLASSATSSSEGHSMSPSIARNAMLCHSIIA